MEWQTRQHLDLRSPSSSLGAGSFQAQCAAFHPTQALLAVAVGRQIVEFDVLLGCKLSNVDIGGTVVRMAYSPAGGHIIVAVLEDWTIRAWDLDTEHTSILYSPLDKKSERSGGRQVEVHIALTPLRHWLFFGAHQRTSVNVVGTIEGARPAQKIKTDVKKPITDLACHPRSPLLYIAYADGIIRSYNILSWTVQYTLAVDPSTKLLGAGAMAFHSALDIVFVGDRGGLLLAFDVSNPARPALAGSVQIGTGPISSLAWHSTMQTLMTLTKEGAVEAWRIRTISSPSKPIMRANFFEPAGVDPLDVADVLLQGGGEAVYPVPRVVELLVHPRLNAATILFANMARKGEVENVARQAANMTRDGRKQLLSVLQSARGGSGGGALKERLAALGSANILSEYQLQQQQLMQLQARGSSKIAQPTLADHARKAFLYGNPKELFASSGPMKTLPLLSIADPSFPLRDLPVCQPFQTDCNFFSAEHGVFVYPARVDFMDGCNLMGYSLATGEYSVYRKLAPVGVSGAERAPKHIVYSAKQNVWLIFFECRGHMCETVLVRNSDGAGSSGERALTLPGRDGAFTGFHDDQFAILEEDGLSLKLYALEGAVLKPVQATPPPPEVVDIGIPDLNGGLDPNDFAEPGMYSGGRGGGGGGGSVGGRPPVAISPDAPMQFIFESPVQRIFGTPQEYSVLYVVAGSHLGLARLTLSEGSMGSSEGGGGQYLLSTRQVSGRCLKLKPMELVLQVRWQETTKGPVAGVVTTQRLLLLSSSLETIACAAAPPNSAYPAFRTCTWVGPTLLFTTATAVSMLGWDGIIRPVVTVDTPQASLVGALNDRLVLACRTGGGGPVVGSKGSGTVEIRSRMVGLLEPLLIGWATLQQVWDSSVDLKGVTYKLTSRFDSLRTTPRTADVLVLGPPVSADLAVELAQSGPQFTQELRCSYAIRARRFETALGILKDEFLRSKDYPRCPPTSRLFQRFRELGRACIKHGQFDRAKETFETAEDYESLFDLFICHQNPSALRRLAQKLEEVKGDPELKRLCDRLLQVRSTGWGQGGMLASLAGESLAPKPAEWGGGNWELREGADGVKAVVEWDLAGEVIAYMKTAGLGGAVPMAIPNIIADSLGVILGTQRGRGAVASEPIIAPKFDPSAHGNGSLDSNGGMLDGAERLFGHSRSGSTMEDGSPEVSHRHSRRPSMASAMGGGGDDPETDEQARAAEEFKRGMYGAADYSSSDDDEGAVKKTRIRIRIKDKKDVAGSAAVDVNKLRESTQKLRLGEGGSNFGSLRKSGLLATPAHPLNTHRSSNSTLDSPTASAGRDSFASRAGSVESTDFMQRAGLAAPVFGAAPGTEYNQDLGYPGGNIPPHGAPPYHPNLPMGASFGSVQDLSNYNLQGMQGVPPGAPLPPNMYGAPGYPPQQQQYMPQQPGYPLNPQDFNMQGGGMVMQQPQPGYPSGSQDFNNMQGGGGMQQQLPPGYAQGSQDFNMQGGVGFPPQAGYPPPPQGQQDFGLPGGGIPPLPPQGGVVAAGPLDLSIFGAGVPPQAPAAAAPGAGETPPMSMDLGSFGGGSQGGSGPTSVGGVFYTPPVSVSGTPQAMSAAPSDGPQGKVLPGQVPRGAPASTCFKFGVSHIEQNQLSDAISCLDEAFLALQKDVSLGKDVKAQARLASQYKIAVLLLQEIEKLSKADKGGAVGAKEEMARLARHLGSLQLQAKHRISCIRTAVKRNMDVQNYAYSKKMLDLLLSKAPANKQGDLRGLVNVCMQRGLNDRAIDGQEDASKFCAATYGRLPTIGHDSCDLCGANFSTTTLPLCTVCGMGSIHGSSTQSAGGPFASPF